MKILILYLTALSLAYGSSASAQGRLIEESTHGVARRCVYEAPTSTIQERAAISRTGDQRQTHRTGSGEPCPASLPRKAKQQKTTVPSLALLSGSRIDGGLRHCTYSYLGRDYSRPVGIARTCPLTPNFVEP